jgi:plasmid stabilization system protein ParE
MALKVRWTQEAADQLDGVIEYLELNWSEKEIRTFFRKLEEAVTSIAEHPDRNKLSERKGGAREYQLTRHTTIFYDSDDAHVTILLLWQNLMDPKKLR